MSLGDLSKSKSRTERDDEQEKEDMEEMQAIAEQERDIKQHFIDIKTGK